MENSHRNGSSMNTAKTSVRVMMARSIERVARRVCIAQCLTSRREAANCARLMTRISPVSTTAMEAA